MEALEEIVSFRNLMDMEVDNGILDELDAQHMEEISTEELAELRTMQYTKVLQLISTE